MVLTCYFPEQQQRYGYTSERVAASVRRTYKVINRRESASIFAVLKVSSTDLPGTQEEQVVNTELSITAILCRTACANTVLIYSRCEKISTVDYKLYKKLRSEVF